MHRPSPEERQAHAAERQADALERIAWDVHSIRRILREQSHDLTDEERREIMAALTSANQAGDKSRAKLQKVLGSPTAHHPVASAADHTTQQESQ